MGSSQKGNVKATFKINQVSTYSIKYNANGGTKAPATQIKKKNKSLKLSTKKPTRKGYTFKGWATSKSSKKVTYKAGATMSKTTNKNMTLYAVWKVNTYKITYKLNRGKNHSKNPSSYKVTTSTITLKNPTRKGYTFKGWYTSSSFKSSTKVTKITKGSTGNKILYAKWKKK